MISDSTPKFLTKLFGKMDGEQKASRGFFLRVVVLEISFKGGGGGYHGLPFFLLSSQFCLVTSKITTLHTWLTDWKICGKRCLSACQNYRKSAKNTQTYNQLNYIYLDKFILPCTLYESKWVFLYNNFSTIVFLILQYKRD